jgi:hypothetical protein
MTAMPATVATCFARKIITQHYKSNLVVLLAFHCNHHNRKEKMNGVIEPGNELLSIALIKKLATYLTMCFIGEESGSGKTSLDIFAFSTNKHADIFGANDSPLL